jgi:hypothetical protein
MINVEIGIPRSDDIDARLEATGIDTLEYSIRWRKYRISLDKDTLERQRELLKDLFSMAYQERSS